MNERREPEDCDAPSGDPAEDLDRAEREALLDWEDSRGVLDVDGVGAHAEVTARRDWLSASLAQAVGRAIASERAARKAARKAGR